MIIRIITLEQVSSVLITLGEWYFSNFLLSSEHYCLYNARKRLLFQSARTLLRSTVLYRMVLRPLGIISNQIVADIIPSSGLYFLIADIIVSAQSCMYP